MSNATQKINEFIQSNIQTAADEIKQAIVDDLEDYEGIEDAKVEFLGNVFSDGGATWLEFRFLDKNMWCTDGHEGFRKPRQIKLLSVDSLDGAMAYSREAEETAAIVAEYEWLKNR